MSNGFLTGCESFCRGVLPSRRDIVRAGAFGLLGGLATPTAASQKQSKKSVILLFMWGGPSHIDTWDPKPDAMPEVRGLFQSVQTNVLGLRISEHFPRLATRADKYAVIRSMTHTDPAHLSPTHHLFTGRIAAKPNSDADGPSRADAPCIGSVVEKVAPATGPAPTAVTLPWIVSHPAAPGGMAPGQNGGWLGPGFDPFVVSGDPNSPGFRVAGLVGPADVTAERTAGRADLLRALEAGKQYEGFGGLRSKAFDLLSSPAVASAFDLSREPVALRDRYGRNTHGQSCLLARRLVEAGSRMVTVNWHNDGQTFWDTHGNNFPSLKNRLMPPADRGFAALLDDLEARGLLANTMVVWVGEFGRTPRVENAGRQHWPRCYSAVLAGGGIRGGVIYGSSDKIGAYPAENPVSPADMTATIYHTLGIDPGMSITDRLGRTQTLTEGKPLRALMG
ncbi:MAG TPA: DUF1501 domain-containing protein [Gemmata sp.]|nr:DUF1501 domain-containing protein [Gemmata sp.]